MPQFLVVDDNIPTGRALVRLLQSAGHDAEFVSSGRDALHQLEHLRPEVVVLDWMMPEMDGMEVLRIVRSDPRFDGVRVVMFSAVSEPSRVGDTLRMGAQDFIIKGTPWSTIYSRLQKMVDPISN